MRRQETGRLQNKEGRIREDEEVGRNSKMSVLISLQQAWVVLYDGI